MERREPEFLHWHFISFQFQNSVRSLAFHPGGTSWSGSALNPGEFFSAPFPDSEIQTWQVSWKQKESPMSRRSHNSSVIRGLQRSKCSMVAKDAHWPLLLAEQVGEPAACLLPQLVPGPSGLDREAGQRLEELRDTFAGLGRALVIGRRLVHSRSLLSLGAGSASLATSTPVRRGQMTYLSDSERSRLLQEAKPQSREVRTQVRFQAEDDRWDAWAVSLGHALPLFSDVSTIHLRSSRTRYGHLRDRLQVALVSDVDTDDYHVEGCH